MGTIVTAEQLQGELFNILGLEPYQGKLYDTESNEFLLMNGEFIYTKEATVIYKKGTRCNIFKNVKLMSYLLQCFIHKETEDSGLAVSMLYFEDMPTKFPSYPKRSLAIITNKGNIRTSFYYNQCIAYIEAMYILSGTPLPLNLHSFDYTVAEIENMMKERNK